MEIKPNWFKAILWNYKSFAECINYLLLMLRIQVKDTIYALIVNMGVFIS